MTSVSATAFETSAPTQSRVFVIGLLVSTLALAATWWSFPSVWLDNRTHGFLAAALSGYMLWTQRRALLLQGEPQWAALPLVLGGSFLWLAGQIMSAQVIHQFAAPVLLWCWLLAVKGPRAARAAVPAALALSLALPVWEVLTWTLQLLASSIGGMVVRLAGVKATITKEIITTQYGTFIVADSCSGLGFFLTALTLGLSYALLFTTQWTLRWRIVATAAALALVANWVRVVGLVLIGHHTRMQSPLMQDHELFGWVIFAVAMGLFFALAARMERSYRAANPSGPDHEQASAHARATDRVTMPSRQPMLPLLLATVAALVGPLLLYGVRSSPNAPDIAPRVLGIAPRADWQTVAQDSTALPADSAWAPRFQGQSAHAVQYFARTGNVAQQVVRVDRLVYNQERQGAELVGGGNRVAADSTVLEQRLVGPLDNQARTVSQWVVREGQRARVVWSWYRVAGMETSSNAKAKLMSLIAFFAREEGGEAVMVSTPCDGGACAEASARLYEFVTGRPLPSPQGQAPDAASRVNSAS
ncbi:exosortase C-terminal domain/associated protein EpsI [Gemmatimonas sp. UBA7669]|uniref:exosortase C-terminal domain/associated protein EpsI n=1 Tax=Gemmatimonas sp. UBA7669 TaxID=1946568 RepID=UPI0025C17EA7|nr:exosortase C-terminal domain/associated protein EpsI [Gemmatimonas sp. UBA7669]